MCFITNYTAFVLFVIDMAFSGLQDADPLDPFVLVLQDRHMSHLVDTEHVCTFITYQLIFLVVTCNLYIINYKFGFFVNCSFRKYSTLDSK